MAIEYKGMIIPVFSANWRIPLMAKAYTVIDEIDGHTVIQINHNGKIAAIEKE